MQDKVPGSLSNQLGIAIAKRTYKAYRELLDSPRWQRVFNAGARPQRLLWASTGTKDPKASDVLYIKALALEDGGGAFIARRIFLSASSRSLSMIFWGSSLAARLRWKYRTLACCE